MPHALACEITKREEVKKPFKVEQIRCVSRRGKFELYTKERDGGNLTQSR